MNHRTETQLDHRAGTAAPQPGDPGSSAEPVPLGSVVRAIVLKLNHALPRVNCAPRRTGDGGESSGEHDAR